MRTSLRSGFWNTTLPMLDWAVPDAGDALCLIQNAHSSLARLKGLS